MASSTLGGRPPKFDNLQDLQEAIAIYFETEEGKNTPTVSGLALALDTTRRTLLDYCQEDNEFSHTIKKAKNRVEAFMEQKLYGNSVTGLIFNLKNNFAWVDKTETDITSNGETVGQADPLVAAEFAAFLKQSTEQ